MNQLTRTASLVLMLTALAFPHDTLAQSQATTAEINGRIIDPQGRALPGVAVTATNSVTGYTRTVSTNEEGLYRISFLPPGEYELSIELAGFSKMTRRLMTTVGSTLTINQSFSVPALAETILVEEGNNLFRASDYRAAAEKYEEALRLNANNTDIYFNLANSYDNMYRPSRKGEPQNDAYLTKAIEHYTIAAERHSDPKMKRLALEYLVAAYGLDKLNDPNEAEAIVWQMIQLDPTEAVSYLLLADIYEDSGDYKSAEQAFVKAREIEPNDPAVHVQLAGFYNRQGDFEKTIGSLNDRIRIEPNNPEAHYTVAKYYWEKVYRDSRLDDTRKRQYVEDGIQAVDRALQINEDYMEAIAYKDLLLRLQADLEQDPARQQELLSEADALRDRATELRKQKGAGVRPKPH